MDVCSQIHVLDLGPDARQRHARRGAAATRPCWPPTSGTARVSDAPARSADVRAGYGPIEVLHGISLDVPDGLGGGRPRAQRRRQDDVAVRDRRAAPGDQRQHRPRRSSGERRRAGRPRAGRALPRPRGPRHLPQPHRRTSTCAWRPTPAGACATSRPRPTSASRGSPSGARSWPAPCRAASSRCSPWPAAWPPRPALLMLDELSMGLAPLIVEELYAQVAAIAASGVSIVVVEQFAGTVLGVADLAAILVQGRIGAVGAPARHRGRPVGRLPRRVGRRRAMTNRPRLRRH